MNIIIPMAGEGRRFSEQGYKIHKPALPVIDRRTGRELPMVVCAALDLPGVCRNGRNILFIDRDFHKQDGVETVIRGEFPKARFLTIDHLTEGQACTCLLAKNLWDREQELLIAGCDNGMVMEEAVFEQKKKEADCLVFTYRNHESVLANPDAYGWMITDSNDNITELSIKKAVSDNPMKDHAVVATFWFRTADIFIRAAEKMIRENDRIHGEFYVDEAIRHVLELGYQAKVFEIQRYIGWGTPMDYENYMQTIQYWEQFVHDERYLGK
ncbi:nucleotidyltransferase [Candidatus Ventrimonas sp. KK005]